MVLLATGVGLGWVVDRSVNSAQKPKVNSARFIADTSPATTSPRPSWGTSPVWEHRPGEPLVALAPPSPPPVPPWSREAVFTLPEKRVGVRFSGRRPPGMAYGYTLILYTVRSARSGARSPIGGGLGVLRSKKPENSWFFEAGRRRRRELVLRLRQALGRCLGLYPTTYRNQGRSQFEYFSIFHFELIIISKK